MPRIAIHRCSASMDDDDGLCFEVLRDGIGDLAGQTFLDLGSLGITIGQPGPASTGR